MTLAPKESDVSLVEYLTVNESNEFDELELIIAQHSDAIIVSAKKVGEALATIREKKYYRKARIGKDSKVYTTFGEYVQDKYGRGRTMAYHYITVFKIIKILEESNQEWAEIPDIMTVLQLNGDVKKLVSQENIDEKDVDSYTKAIVSQAWKVIVDTAPRDGNNKPLLSKKHVHQVFGVLNDVVKSGAVEVDGNAVPVSVASLAFESNVVQTIAEQIKTDKQYIVENTIKNKKDRFTEKKVDTTPRSYDLKKFFSISCPDHGLTQPHALVKAGFVNTCGCYAIIETVNDKSQFVWYKTNEVQ